MLQIFNIFIKIFKKDESVSKTYAQRGEFKR
jgi:hypothetical protein